MMYCKEQEVFNQECIILMYPLAGVGTARDWVTQVGSVRLKTWAPYFLFVCIYAEA